MINRSVDAPATGSTSLSSSSTLNQVFEVNAVQSTSLQQSGGERKLRINLRKKIIKPKMQKKIEHPRTTEKQPWHKSKFPCLICGDDHYTRDCPHRDEVAKLFKGNSQAVVLTHPFPQQQSLVAQNPTPSIGGNPNHPPSKEASSSAHIYMFNGIDLTTHTTMYNTPPGKPDKEKVTTATTPDPSSTTINPPSRPLQIEKPSFDSILRPPRAQFESQPLILIHVLLKTTTLLNIWSKHLTICHLSKFYNTSLVSVGLSWKPSEL
jgi:hypothetical protein